MTNEEIQLLISDLCPRIPYGVYGTVPVTVTDSGYDMEGFHLDHEIDVDVCLDMINIGTNEIDVTPVCDSAGLRDYVYEYKLDYTWTIEEFTPYLRPMSELQKDLEKSNPGYLKSDEHGKIYIYEEDVQEYFKLLSGGGYDYNNLIEKKLAVEMPENIHKLYEKCD